MRKFLSLVLSVLAAAPLLAARIPLDYRAPARAGGGTARLQEARLDDGVLRQTRLAPEAAPVVGTGLAVGDELALTLFDDRPIALTLEERTPSPLGGASFLASVEGYEGAKTAVVVQTADGLQVDVQDYRARRVYSVFSSASGVVVRESRPSDRPRTCGTPHAVHAGTQADGPPACAREETNPPKLATGSPAYVDLLVAYDQLASTWAKANGGGAENFAAVTVQKMNAALANTGLDEKFRFRLVGVRELAGRGDGNCQDGTSLDAILDSAVGSSGAYNGFDWGVLRTARDTVGADIVCILTDTGSGYGTTGMGFSMNAGNASSFAGSAYNCCAIRAVAAGHTMTHEVGHNMGAGHATAVADASNRGPQYYSYSSGYYFKSGGTRYHTIMAYNADGYGNSYETAPYFSSPAHSLGGVAVGDAAHDNTRTLRNTFAQVAAFRAEKPLASYTVAFDANGGTPAPAARTRSYGETYGPLPEVTRGGYVFLGWFTAPGGGTQVSASTPATANATLYAHWKTGANTLASALNAPGLTVTTGGDAVWYGQSGLSHDGTSAARSSGIGHGQSTWMQTAVTGPADVSFWWRVSSESGYDTLSFLVDGTVSATDSGTSGGWVRKTFSVGGGTHVLKWIYAKDGSASAGEDCGWVDQLAVTKPAPPSYKISFDSNGGSPAPAAFTRLSGAAYGTLPTVSRAGYVFGGWYTAKTGGARATSSTRATGNATLYAHWLLLQLHPASAAAVGPGETAPYASAACVYDGMLSRAGRVAGTVQVKVGKAKPDKRTGVLRAKVSAKVVWADGAGRQSFSGGSADASGAVTPMVAGGRTLALKLGADALGGTLGDCTVSGARSVFAGKTAADRTAASAVLAPWQGPVGLFAEDLFLSLAVSAKGQMAVSGLVDGIKVGGKCPFLAGRDWCAVPVAGVKKLNRAFVVWLPRAGGAPVVADLGETVQGKCGTLRPGSLFWCDWATLSGDLAAAGGTLLEACVPWDVPVRQAGAKWLVAEGARAGKVGFLPGTWDVDLDRAGANPAALKLAYKAKAGTFSGAFKAYALEGARLKSYKLSVFGVLIDGAGYGAASLKRPASRIFVGIDRE